MKFSKKGYLKNSPDVNNPKNIIKGGNITMKGVDFKVHGVDNNGYAKVMTPGYDYNFPNAKYVIETPIKNKEMNGPFKMKPGRGDMPKTGKGLPKDMTNPIMQKIDIRTGRPTIEREESGDVFKGKTITTKTTTPKTVIRTPEGDEAYAKLSPEARKAQDIKFQQSKNVEETKLKTSGLVKPKTTGPSSDFKVDLGKIKERIDPIEKIEVIQQTGGPQTYQGYGRQTVRRVGGGAADIAAQAIKQAPYKETTVVRGIRKSGETKDIFSKGLDKSKHELSGKFIYGEKTGAEKILEKRAEKQRLKNERSGN